MPLSTQSFAATPAACPHAIPVGTIRAEPAAREVKPAERPTIISPSIFLGTKLANEISLKGLFVKNMLEKISNAPDGERAELENALKLGLKAFGTEVAYDED